MAAARAAWGRQRARMAPPYAEGGGVGGAALGRAAPLDEAPPGVRVLLRLQRGGREDVGRQPAELIGPRLVALLFKLKTNQSERGGAGLTGGGGTCMYEKRCYGYVLRPPPPLVRTELIGCGQRAGLQLAAQTGLNLSGGSAAEHEERTKRGERWSDEGTRRRGEDRRQNRECS